MTCAINNWLNNYKYIYYTYMHTYSCLYIMSVRVYEVDGVLPCRSLVTLCSTKFIRTIINCI